MTEELIVAEKKMSLRRQLRTFAHGVSSLPSFEVVGPNGERDARSGSTMVILHGLFGSKKAGCRSALSRAPTEPGASHRPRSHPLVPLPSLAFG